MSLISNLKIVDSRTRALAKAFTWRLTATLTTLFIVFIVTGEIRDAVMIG